MRLQDQFGNPCRVYFYIYEGSVWKTCWVSFVIFPMSIWKCLEGLSLEILTVLIKENWRVNLEIPSGSTWPWMCFDTQDFPSPFHTDSGRRCTKPCWRVQERRCRRIHGDLKVVCVRVTLLRHVEQCRQALRPGNWTRSCHVRKPIA